VPYVLVWTHKKARGFLAAKRTEALEIAPRTLELDVLPHNIFDVESCPDFLFGILHTISIPRDTRSREARELLFKLQKYFKRSTPWLLVML